MTGALESVRTWGRMVKFSHTVFALPFALAGAALAAAESGIRAEQLVWIVLAMVGARNAAMGFNRLADQGYDAENPRTADRALPRRSLSRGAVWAATLALSALFVFASFRLNPLCGWLSPIALVVVLGYSYTKRFTWASHLLLGLARDQRRILQGGLVARCSRLTISVAGPATGTSTVRSASRGPNVAPWAVEMARRRTTMVRINRMKTVARRARIWTRIPSPSTELQSILRTARREYMFQTIRRNGRGCP